MTAARAEASQERELSPAPVRFFAHAGCPPEGPVLVWLRQGVVSVACARCGHGFARVWLKEVQDE